MYHSCVTLVSIETGNRYCSESSGKRIYMYLWASYFVDIRSFFAENKEEKKDGRYLRREFSYSKFQQTMILPDNVDKEKIAASVEHGVLNIELPKLSEEEVKKPNRQIEIK
mgnify:FL=1